MVPSEQVVIYEGTYSNPGYGEFTLCTAQSTSTACVAILSNFSAVSPLDPLILYGSWSPARIWGSHIRLRPVPSHEDTGCAQEDVSHFDMELETVFPRGYGRDTSPFIYREPLSPFVRVQCVSRTGHTAGCGLMNAGEYDETWKGRSETTVRGRADAWFDKMGL